MSDLKRLLEYVRPHWLIFTLAIIAMVAAALFETATGGLLVPVFDQFVKGNAGQNPTLFNLQELISQDDWVKAWISISALLVTFTILKGICEYFSANFMARIGQNAILELRSNLYAHLLDQSAVFFEKHRTNYLVSRIVVSCAAIESAVSLNLRDVLRELFMLICCVAAAFYFNWRLTAGSLIIAPVIAFITVQFSRRLRKLANVTLQGNKELNDTSQESLANHVILKAYNAEERELGRFRNVAGRIARANIRSASIAAISSPLVELVGAGAFIVLFYFGLKEINASRIDAAQFFTFLFFLLRSYDPMRKVSRQYNELVKAFAAARDVWTILDEDDRLPEKPDAIELTTLRDGIKLDHVGFNYRTNRRKILEDISLEIPKGTVVALVGQSGGGKSSLTRLIQRLYDPSEGAIYWDGVDLKDIKIKSLRRQIALVTQETVLFNDSVRQNISYGKPEATDAEIRHAAQVAYADEFIDQLPDGYDTMVGERGVLLSGGQRQRLAIARAVLVNAPVLILDEATSALDTESETMVQKALANLMQDRTSLVIAHRLSTVRKADRIVVMEKGRIVETGTHEELLAHGGTYKMLHGLQFVDMDERGEVIV